MRFSRLCLVFACLGLAAVLITEIISNATGEPSLPFLNVLGGAVTLASLVTGAYAMATLVRHNSRRVRRRALVGMTVAVCTGAAVVSNVFDKYRQLAPPETSEAPAAPGAAEAGPENNDLVKPGWYGELLSDRVLLIITSFEENAAESRRFNRGLFKPVSYATLTVVNTGNDTPVSVTPSDTRLRLADGSIVRSLSLQDVQAHSAGRGNELNNRISASQLVATGAMAPDLPICMDAGFSWARVAAVDVRLGARTVSVPGRFMTAHEKTKMLQTRLP
jgi:hypothetical protein